MFVELVLHVAAVEKSYHILYVCTLLLTLGRIPAVLATLKFHNCNVHCICGCYKKVFFPSFACRPVVKTIMDLNYIEHDA